MKQLLNKVSILCIIFFLAALPVAAQSNDSTATTQLSGKEITAAAKKIIASYSDWNTLQLSGKITIDGLFIRPSLKVWMQRDKQIIISMRAPFVGEVATIDIRPDTFCIVNKMQKVYVRESLQQLIAGLPVNISNVQDLLLGRIFVPGGQTLSTSNFTKMDFFAGQGLLYVVPRLQQSLHVSAGFIAATDSGLMQGAYIEDTDNGNNAAASYSYKDKKTIIDLVILRDAKERNIALEFSAPEKNAKPLQVAEIKKNYRKVPLSSFLKSLK